MGAGAEAEAGGAAASPICLLLHSGYKMSPAAGALAAGVVLLPVMLLAIATVRSATLNERVSTIPTGSHKLSAVDANCCCARRRGKAFQKGEWSSLPAASFENRVLDCNCHNVRNSTNGHP